MGCCRAFVVEYLGNSWWEAVLGFAANMGMGMYMVMRACGDDKGEKWMI